MLDEAQLAFLRSALGFYEDLSGAERAKLERAASAMRFPKGKSLRSDDGECLGLLLVKSGELRTFIRSEEGREITLYRLSPGELCVLSATCVLSSIRFDVSIEASSDAEVVKIGLGAFEEIMRENLRVENFAYKSAAERFSDVIWAVQQLVFMSFDARLAIFLLDESAKPRQGRGGDGEIRATHEEIARNVGSAREVVSRALKAFESRGIISLGRGSVRVLDRKALQELL